MTRKIGSIFMLIVGGFAAAGWAEGISKTGGWLWICGGLVIGLWKFVKGALAEGKVAEVLAKGAFKEDVLAVSVTEGVPANADITKEVDINGEKATISLVKA